MRLLDRYILAELLRSILLTTVVLVAVIAFGATIKPLASGLLEPGDVAKYIALAIVPMLQFALPFAAGFGATLVMHRMTGDNEVLACAASGLSYRRLLLPIAGLGATISAILLVLVHFVIPHFWLLMQRTATEDAARLFISSVENREAFVFGDTQIFAERLHVDPALVTVDARGEPLRAGVRHKTRLVLQRVVAVEVGDDGEIETDISARAAVADFYEVDGRTVLHLAMSDTLVYSAADNRIAGFPRLRPDPVMLPDDFRDRPKLMSLPRLLEVRRQPDLFRGVIESRRQLAEALQAHEFFVAAARRVETAGLLAAAGTARDDGAALPSEFEFRADRLRAGVLTRAGAGRVQVEEVVGGERRRLIECDRAELVVRSQDEAGVVCDAVLTNCVVADARAVVGAPPIEMPELLLRDLRFNDLAPTDVFDLSSDDLRTRAGDAARNPQIGRLVAALEGERRELLDDTGARIWQRTSLATTGVLLILLGAVLAMKMRNSLPLSIYLIAFLPSILDLLLISGGEQSFRDGLHAEGLAVMWAGNAALALLTAWTFVRLSRN